MEVFFYTTAEQGQFELKGHWETEPRCYLNFLLICLFEMLCVFCDMAFDGWLYMHFLPGVMVIDRKLVVASASSIGIRLFTR